MWVVHVICSEGNFVHKNVLTLHSQAPLEWWPYDLSRSYTYVLPWSTALAWDGDSLQVMVAIEELQFQGRVELQNIWVASARVKPSWGLFVCLYFGTCHQADAHSEASLYPSFNSIRNTHVCHRLQPHLYPGLIGISLGRDVLPDCDISQRMSSSTPLSEPEIIVELRLLTVNDEHISVSYTHLTLPTILLV